MKLVVLLILIAFNCFSQSSIVDERDGKVYKVVQLGNLFWMAENLRYDATGSVCLENCDQIRFYDYQYLEDVCPEGWRLPTVDEWKVFTDSFVDAEKVEMMEGNQKLYRVDFLDEYNIFDSNSLNIQPYGRMEGGKIDSGNFIDFWTINPKTDDRFHMHLTSYSIAGHSHKFNLMSSKPEEYRLFAVRCVCERID